MITKAIKKFFIETFNQDVTNVEVILGEETCYDHSCKRTIFISSNYVGIGAEIAVVHELCHMLQIENNISLTLHELDIKALDSKQRIYNIKTNEDLLEIDAHLVCSLFVYRECGLDGLNLYFNKRFEDIPYHLIHKLITKIENRYDEHILADAFSMMKGGDSNRVKVS